MSITTPDPARGGGIDGLVIAYRYQGRVRTVRANVTWLLCGTDPAQDICLEYDEDWREDDGGPSADATNT